MMAVRQDLTTPLSTFCRSCEQKIGGYADIALRNAYFCWKRLAIQVALEENASNMADQLGSGVAISSPNRIHWQKANQKLTEECERVGVSMPQATPSDVANTFA